MHECPDSSISRGGWHLLCVKGAIFASQALADDFRVLVHKHSCLRGCCAGDASAQAANCCILSASPGCQPLGLYSMP